MLSIDITDKQVKLVRGTLSGNKIRVLEVETRDLTLGSVSNGYITDIPMVAGEITDIIATKNIKEKEAIVCINSGSILYKEMAIPKPKKLSNTAAIEAMIGSNMGISNEYNISYTIVGETKDENQNPLIKVLATACPQRMVDGYIRLFTQLGLNLKQINISNNCISRLILNTPKLESAMPLMLVQVDNDFVNINLYEGGQVTLNRYTRIDPYDYGNDDDYVNQAVYNEVFRTTQFLSQRRDARPLKEIMFYGQVRDFIALSNAVQSFNVPCHILSTPTTIASRADYEFTKFANAIGALYKVDKELEHINLLDTTAAKESKGLNTFFIGMAAAAILSVGALFGANAVINVINDGIKADITKVNAQINDTEFQARLKELSRKEGVLANFESYKTSIANAEIILGEALTYTGSELTRDFTVALLDGIEIDYTVSGNTGTDAGDYELTINGQGNFTGSKSASWSIAKATQSAPETPVAVNETIKAKADGKITGVTSDMEYKLEGASEYIAISETEIVNLAAGTYLVRYKENANHLAGADKQLIIADGAMITVSFNSNEGTAVDSITCEYNQAITAPAEPTKENFVFAGWYKDAECLDLWNFGNALTEDITLYAKWNDKPVYSVSGKVTDGESGLGGITVTLKQGNTIIATTTTAADGSYSFITEDGLYNIVAEKEENDNSTIKTVKIEVTESANVNDVVFVATDINSELEIKPDTPQIIVGGLDEEAQTVSSSNGNVDDTVKMTVESTEDITGSDDATGQEQRQTEQKEIKKVSGNRYIQFIEINLTQSISGAESTKLEETSGLIEIIIPFEKGNKRNITVYRYHGSASEKLGAGIGNANADGEYFEVKENHIVVYAKKFSTYAIGYDLPSSGGGGSSVTRYTVKFDTNGGSSVSSAAVTKNAKVAEPKTPEKDGYTFGGWYTDKEFAEKYDFESKVTKNFTLYAKWDKHDDEQSSTDTHNCPSLAFDDLDITKWYPFDTDYVIENGIFKGTTETTFEPDSAQTRAMMVTVLYRVEGEPAVNRSIPFADVDMGAYYANAVIWGQQNGIIKGYSETEFGPDDKITREQIAAIMHRYAQYKGYDVSVGENTNILSYDDFDSISEYAIPSMQWAVGSGLIKGKSESTLNPLDNATRAEIAAILHRFIEANK